MLHCVARALWLRAPPQKRVCLEFLLARDSAVSFQKLITEQLLNACERKAGLAIVVRTLKILEASAIYFEFQVRCQAVEAKTVPTGQQT